MITYLLLSLFATNTTGLVVRIKALMLSGKRLDENQNSSNDNYVKYIMSSSENFDVDILGCKIRPSKH